MTDLKRRIEELDRDAEKWQNKSRRMNRIMMGFFGGVVALCVGMLGYLIADRTGPEVESQAGLISSLYSPDNLSWQCQYRTKDGDAVIWFPGDRGCPAAVWLIYRRGRFSGSPGNVRLAEVKAK